MSTTTPMFPNSRRASHDGPPRTGGCFPEVILETTRMGVFPRALSPIPMATTSPRWTTLARRDGQTHSQAEEHRP